MTRYGIVALIALVLGVVGCNSTGGSQLENTVYDSHRRIVRLDQGLADSVNKLNVTTPELIARVSESDQQARTLRSMLEENQFKIEALQRSLDGLTVTLYRELNLSPPMTTVRPPAADLLREPAGVAPEGGTVTVSPPPIGPSAIRPSSDGRLDGRLTPTPGAAVAPVGVRPPTTPPAAVAGDPEADYQRAQKSYANGDYALALAQFDAYLQRYPNTDLCSNAQLWKGRCYYDLDQHEQALVECEKLRTNYPNAQYVPFAMHIQAMAHKQLGQTQRAIALFKEVVENYPMAPAATRSKTELEKLQGN